MEKLGLEQKVSHSRTENVMCEARQAHYLRVVFSFLSTDLGKSMEGNVYSHISQDQYLQSDRPHSSLYINEGTTCTMHRPCSRTRLALYHWTAESGHVSAQHKATKMGDGLLPAFPW
jgi:hypothetical protein